MGSKKAAVLSTYNVNYRSGRITIRQVLMDEFCESNDNISLNINVKKRQSEGVYKEDNFGRLNGEEMERYIYLG